MPSEPEATDDLLAAISAVEAAGYVVVAPKAYTNEMDEAAFQAEQGHKQRMNDYLRTHGGYPGDAGPYPHIWLAMLAAAPKPWRKR